MSAFLDAIEAHLAAAGVAGAGTEWPVQKIIAQDGAGQALVLYETGGAAPEQATDRRWVMPSFQAVALATTPKLARDKAGDVMTTLDRAAVAGFSYFLTTQSTPFALGPDQRGRHRFAANFRAGAS